MKLEPSTGNKTFLLFPALNKSIQTQPSTVNAAEKDNNKKREREREKKMIRGSELMEQHQ